MAKATKRVSTQRRTASEKPKSNKAAPRKGLAFINAAPQRNAAEPNLKRELKMRRQPEDVQNLSALYDAYMGAVDAMIGVINQPRAAGVDDVIDAEWNHLLAKAWTVAEHLKGLRPQRDDRETFVRVLTDCAFDMGADADVAASVLRDAMLIDIAADYHPRSIRK